MKKLILISLILALGISFAFAQSIYGLRAGLNISSFGGDSEMDSKIGFNGGLFMQYRVHPMLILQSELNYTQRGAQDELSIMGVKTEIKQTLHYAELPVYLKLDLGEANLKFQPYLGPELRYLISAKKTSKVGGDESSGDIEDITDMDFGLGLGIDMVFNTNMLVGARYSMGLIDISEDSSDVTNNSIMINLGFLY
ncbi:MAG: porin family protein [Candidatus Cloacimonetes bacterium]|jgi:opacity protein-like surface antigen|nr:PorT family protein [Candidatus Cloacimonadota bacterium]MDD3579245.1 porin family protein [Candidatus Cloacimonadota bacterium]MDD4035695.1 porin family protein [Candidatus Cloacimonadota bacterium]